MQEVSKFSLHRKERWEDIISQEEDNETNNTQFGYPFNRQHLYFIALLYFFQFPKQKPVMAPFLQEKLKKNKIRR